MTGVPMDRVHFLEAQRRNRRRSLRFGLFAIVSVAIAGLPLCVIIAPLLLGGLLIVAHVVNLFAPLGENTWAMLHDAVFVGPTIYRKLRGVETAISWHALAIIYVVPGGVAMLLAWPFVRLVSRRAGVGSLLHGLGSRAPDPTRLVEQQMVNVVGEMAVAAGLSPPPAVRVIDSAAVNAVAVGLTVHDTTLLVTHGFLERLDRDERQAVVAHLIGSVGNGDLEIAATILSVFETWTLVATVLEAPVSPRRRAFLRQFVRVAVAELRGGADEREARALVDALLAGAESDVEGFLRMVEGIEPKSAADGCYIILVRVPFIVVAGLATIVAREAANLVTVLVLGPWLAAMWRARRRLADATAVQLTRNPSALASAVRTFAACDVQVAGGWPVHFLFPVWVPVTDVPPSQFTTASTNVVGMRLEPEPRLRHLAELGAALEDTRRVRFVERLRAALPNWRELGTAIGWGIVAVALIALLIAVTVLAASLLLLIPWYVLRWLTALTR